jgi:hypothetical protein
MSNTPEVSLPILTYQNVGWLTEMIGSYVDRNKNVTLYYILELRGHFNAGEIDPARIRRLDYILGN